MSGGSYEYLYCKDSIEFISQYNMELIEKMHNAIKSRDNTEKIIEVSEDIIVTLANVRNILKALDEKLDIIKPIWRVIEFYESGDLNEKDVIDSINKFNELMT